MGANYDVIIRRSRKDGDIIAPVAEFLSAKGLTVVGVCPLSSAEIDENAILVSPSTNEWAEVVALSSALRIELTTWYECNPLAIYLSNYFEQSIHIWSLDSGAVAGYAFYSNGDKVEADYVFTKSAKRRDILMAGVPVPERHSGRALAGVLGMGDDFDALASQNENLEIAVAALISRFGFNAHLIDFYEASEDKKGIRIVDRNYLFVDLVDWTAILFNGY